ncbi:MAG: DNA-binding response regulator [Acidobacteria bacterium]|nr:MAG: DNA-binding response regulator [Acidobacteriota bacterium]
MIRVLIVDDHPIVREGVTAVLDRERDIDVVGAADTVGEGLRLAAKFHPDVILLDLKLPDADAVDGVTSFAGKGRGVVVFTAHDTDDDVFRAIRGGARGYLLKGSAAAEIARAIRQVHAGESYLSPRIAAKLVKEVTEPRRRTGLLSARERGVLRLVAAGLSNRQIAEALSISERTVKFHVTAIFNKLGAENRAQAVALAAERGLLSTP